MLRGRVSTKLRRGGAWRGRAEAWLDALAGALAIASLLAVGFAAQAAAPPASAPALPSTVARVDTARYAGTWYEIARVPNTFQRQCAGDVSATYAMRGDGSLAVLNRCRRADGSVDEARGIARPQGGDRSGARLEVSFLPAWLQWLPLGWGDYWIVALDPEYRVAAVSDRKREYLWVLAREPQIEAERYETLLAQLRAEGFAVERLVRTSQPTAR